MSLVGSGGALNRLGITPTPVGTLDELEREGIDPQKVGCCYQTRAVRRVTNAEGIEEEVTIRGCPVWASCRFGRPDMGAFKGKGPQNVPYMIRTLDGAEQMNFLPCYSFVRVIQSRMDWANAQRAEGKAHELIRIVGTEGMTIKMNIARNRHPEDKLNPTFENAIEDVVVPKFKRPSERNEVGFSAAFKAFEDQIAAKEREAQEMLSVVGNKSLPEPREKKEATKKADGEWK